MLMRFNAGRCLNSFEPSIGTALATRKFFAGHTHDLMFRAMLRIVRDSVNSRGWHLFAGSILLGSDRRIVRVLSNVNLSHGNSFCRPAIQKVPGVSPFMPTLGFIVFFLRLALDMVAV